MAVFYRLSQVTSPKQKGYGKWYPRAVMTSTVDTDALATIMQRNCTVKKTFITGCSVQEAPKNDVDTSKPKDDEAGSNTGGNTGGSTGGNTGGNGGDGGEDLDKD
jgi:hypothetical protein